MVRKILGILLAVVVLGVFLVTGTNAAEKEIKIGFVTDLTSMLSLNGIPMRQAAILAMEEVNYTVAGKPVKIIFEDEASDPAVAMDRVRKLVETDKVSILIGPFHAGCAAAGAEYAARTKTPNIGAWYNLPNEAQVKAPWSWATFGTNQSPAYAAGVYAAEVLGYKTATAMAIDYAAGRASVEGFAAAFTERGGKMIQEQWIPMGTKDIAPYITALKPADVLVPWFAGVTATVGVRQIREFKVKMPVVFPQCQFPAHPKQIVEIGDDGVGMITAEAYVWTINTPKNKKFVEAYQKRWGELPSGNAGGAYLTMQVAFEALKKTKGDTSSQAIAKALDETNVEGFLGPIRYAPSRVGISNLIIHKVVKVNNEYRTEILKDYKVRTDKVGNKLVQSIAK